MTRGNSPSRRSVYPLGQPAPEPGDVLISRTGGPDGAHALRVVPNPQQIRYVSYGAALDDARRFAREHHVDVWVEEEGDGFALVARHRATGRTV